MGHCIFVYQIYFTVARRIIVYYKKKHMMQCLSSPKIKMIPLGWMASIYMEVMDNHCHLLYHL